MGWDGHAHGNGRELPRSQSLTAGWVDGDSCRSDLVSDL